ncbi:class I adenylate-forming enzyme family protein [Hansschlegelia quercus]|uniref:Long-chain fatty acid--CoA ligase n=1 Tax=Hansschlegelia quercus TaxID=2528245 RepID=A0A4Q9GIL5_9HYPH|nr:class I adenylate-forming enzyme family protein [Hansschlegelia quercus]TBN51803.1 long-chain fatty acid--CoA ligase [Hansschlegelia quercus]
MTNPLNLGDVVNRTGAPDVPMIIGLDFDGAETTLSRAELDAMADAFARGLLARGLKRGDRVAILSANRPDYVALALGAMRAGIVPAPVNFKFPKRTIADVLADSGARVVFCDAARRDQVPEGVEAVDFDGPALASWLDPGPFEPVTPAADEPGLTLYTSGSTGKPKGVLLSHASHLWVVRTRMADDDLAGERLLVAAPLYHMNALANVLLACASGATVVLLPQFQAKAYIEAIDRLRCTWATAVPPMIAMMLREKEALSQADLASVRVVRMGSAPVNDALAGQIRALLPNARIINAYGTTEGGPVVFSDKGGAPSGSVGRPHPDVVVRLVGGTAPETGVLQMKSPAIMLGYHNRPDVRSPITEDGFYDTGDVFRRDEDGFYFFVGRVDDMFVSGGENIFPGEVEAVLETHPDVLQASVVPVDDEIKGQKPVAFVVRRPGSTVDEQALKTFVLENAPAYAHPRRVWFLDQMLLASTNKIDRAGLRARAEAELRNA